MEDYDDEIQENENEKKSFHQLALASLRSFTDVITYFSNNNASMTPSDLAFCVLRLGQIPPLNYKSTEITAKAVKLLTNVEEHLDDMTPLDLSAYVSWGVVKAGIHNMLPSFMSSLNSVVMRRIGEASGYNLSSVAWAFATAQYKSSKLFEEISKHAIGRLGEMRPQNLANIAWAFAKAGEPAKDLFNAIADESLTRMPSFNEQNIANLAWSFAKANVKANKLFQVIALAASPRLREFKAQGIVNLAWAFSQIGVTGPNVTDLYEAVAYEVEERHDELSSRSLVTIDRSFKRADFYYPLVRLLELVEKRESSGKGPIPSEPKSRPPPTPNNVIVKPPPTDADGWTTVGNNRKTSNNRTAWKETIPASITNNNSNIASDVKIVETKPIVPEGKSIIDNKITSSNITRTNVVVNSLNVEHHDDKSKHQGAPHVSALEKTDICRFFKRGKCQYGKDCHFAHGENELLARNNKKYAHGNSNSSNINNNPPTTESVDEVVVVREIVKTPPVVREVVKTPTPSKIPTQTPIVSKTASSPPPKVVSGSPLSSPSTKENTAGFNFSNIAPNFTNTPAVVEIPSLSFQSSPTSKVSPPNNNITSSNTTLPFNNFSASSLGGSIGSYNPSLSMQSFSTNPFGVPTETNRNVFADNNMFANNATGALKLSPSNITSNPTSAPVAPRDSLTDHLAAILMGTGKSNTKVPDAAPINPFYASSSPSPFSSETSGVSGYNFNSSMSPSSSTIDLNAGGGLCSACYSARATYALLPCGHLCICADCAPKLRPNVEECPKCSMIVSSAICIKL